MKTKLLFIIILISLGLSGPIQAENLKMATGEWVPYTSPDMKGYGEFTSLVSIVIREMGMEPQYFFYPWRRCFEAVVLGQVWAGFPYSYTEKRAKDVYYSAPLDDSNTVFFVYQKPGENKIFSYNQLSDLKRYRIGGVTGYFYEEKFRDEGIEVDYANKEINNIEKLILGRIDLFPVNKRVGWHLIRTHFPEEVDNFQTLAKPLSRNPLHLIVSKRYPDAQALLKKFNSALKTAREKGLLTNP